MPGRPTNLLNVQIYMPDSSASAEIEGDGFWIGLYETERFMHIVPQGVWTRGGRRHIAASCVPPPAT